MSKYLDNTGVQYLWGKIKAAFVAKESGKGLSTNDYTTTDKNKVASALTSHQTIKQDGITGATANRFGTCSTAAGTAAKAVSITSGTFNLEAGARVSVKFSNANTANTPTLNVNSKGAKNIFHRGAQITSGANKALLAGTVEFVYDGTQWHLLGNYYDTTSIPAGNITSGYLNIHPENSPVVIPMINNDIAFLLKRGGSAVVQYDGTTQNVDISAVFDGSPSYWAINPTNVTTVTITLTLHKAFSYSNTIYVDFGNSGWRSKSVKIEVMNSGYADDTWSQKGSITNNSLGHYSIGCSHAPTGGSSGNGFNMIRLTFSDWATASIFRIAAIGVYNYGSRGLRETFLPRDGGDLYGGLTPYSNSTYDLGSTSKYWKNAYLTQINGVAVGSSPKFTDTTYENKAAASGGTAVSLVTTGEKYTWNAKTSNTGTVTKVSTGAGLTGGDITTTGTVKANLTSETKLANAAADGTETSGRVYPVRLDKNGKLAVNVPWTNVNSGYAASGHTHSLSIATDTGTNELTLAHGSKYKLTAGGDSFVFTMPASGNTDTKVTSAANHYAPAADTNSALTANATGATAAWSIDVVKGVTISRDAKGHVTDVAVTSGKIPANPNTDTKVTSAANHYAPSADSNSELTAAISGTAGTYALNTEYTVLTGVKAQRDAKGHVTGLTYTAQKVKDTNTTYGVATASANGLMAKADKSKLDSFGNAVIFQGTCDTAAATVAKVVTCADFTSADLVVGAKIYVTFTNTNSGAAGSLTLNVNSTGAKPLKEFRNGVVANIAGNAYLVAHHTYLFHYDGTNWCTVMDYDSNSVDRLAMPHYIKAGSTGIFPYSLVALDKTGAWSAFTTSGGTGTNKTLNTTTDFLYPPEILVYEANNTAAANANVASSGVSYASYPDVYLNYSCNCGTTGFDTNEPVYIQCNITSTGHWRFENITQTFVDGKYYIYLGKTRNEAGGYRIWLSDVHPVYYYDGTSLTEAESHRLGSCRIVVASKSGVSSLPTTISHSLVKSNMYVLQETLSNPHAQMGNWTVTTADGSVTISGNIHGSTDITLLLG